MQQPSEGPVRNSDDGHPPQERQDVIRDTRDLLLAGAHWHVWFASARTVVNRETKRRLLFLVSLAQQRDAGGIHAKWRVAARLEG